MMMIWLPLFPILAGILAIVTANRRVNRVLLVTTALVHLSLTIGTWLCPPEPILNGWFALDPLGKLFLTITSVLFLAAAFYGADDLRRNEHGAGDPARSESIFVGCMMFFLSTMTMVTLCEHFGLLWVTIEATTLASAPLIYFHQSRHALEATWKYLIICSFGIALALLGNFFLAIATASGAHAEGESSMLLSNLIASGSSLQVVWLKAAFLLLFVGYGTKMGIAPLHTWLPDAHSEAPSFVSALLSGALLNCAFLGILRIYQVCVAAGQASFVQPIFVGFGLLSMAFAAIFIVRQVDFKRMLAYSSVEHMGILSLSAGLGGSALFGGMLHSINHSLTKAMLFLVAGNLVSTFRTQSTQTIRGVLDVLPASGVIWFIGLFAITGTPPFGPFISEFLILKAAIEQGRIWIAVLYLLFLAIVFIGMLAITLRMLLGKPSLGEVPEANPPRVRERFWTVAVPASIAALVILFGVHIPQFINQHLHEIAHLLGGES